LGRGSKTVKAQLNLSTLMVMGSVGLWVGLVLRPNFHYGMVWVGLDRSFGGLGWVEEIGPTDYSDTAAEYKMPVSKYCSISKLEVGKK